MVAHELRFEEKEAVGMTIGASSKSRGWERRQGIPGGVMVSAFYGAAKIRQIILRFFVITLSIWL